MKRITTDNVNEMGIVGLVHNCCYIGKDGSARYRDLDIDIDARELAKELLKELAKQDVDFESDGDFDDWVGTYYGEDGIGTIHGLIAMFYQNIWAMAELRENLKRYEDLEEQGRLVVLPCKQDDRVYMVLKREVKEFIIGRVTVLRSGSVVLTLYGYQGNILAEEIGKTVFLTREEAEAALEKMGERK